MIFEFNLFKGEIEYFKQLLNSSCNKYVNKYFFRFLMKIGNDYLYYSLMLIKNEEFWNVHYFNELNHYEITKEFKINQIFNLLNELWDDKYHNKSKGNWLNKYELFKHLDAHNFYYKNSSFDANSAGFQFMEKSEPEGLSVFINESGIKTNKQTMSKKLNRLKGKLLTNIDIRT